MRNETLNSLFGYYRESEHQLIDTLGKASNTEILKYKDFRHLATDAGFSVGYQKNFMCDGKVEVETIWYNTKYALIIYAETNGNHIGTARLYGQLKIYEDFELELLKKFENIDAYGFDNGIVNFIAPVRTSKDFVNLYMLIHLYETPTDWTSNDEWKSFDAYEGFQLLNYNEEVEYSDLRVVEEITEEKVYSNSEILRIVHGIE